MAIDFPFPATLGQLYVFNGVTYKFSAQNVWEVVGSTSAILSVNVQVFSAAGAFTYTPIAGMKYCVIECVGGGAGGGWNWSWDFWYCNGCRWWRSEAVTRGRRSPLR